MDSYDRIIRVSPKITGGAYMDQLLREPQKIFGNDMPIPYYQAYGQSADYYMEDLEDERDMERIKEMYPEVAKRWQDTWRRHATRWNMREA